MSWAMKGLYLILMVFYLWKDTSGFSVLKRASVVGWQSGNSDAAHDQNIQLAKTPQPFVPPSRNSTNGNVGGGGGNSSSVPFTSEVQTAQGDFHYVQVPGGGVSTLQEEQGSSRTNIPQDQSLTYSIQSISTQASGSQTQSWSQAGSTRQDSASQSAPDSSAQGSYGAESSGYAKWYTILHGQTIPSSSRTVATNQVSGSQAQSYLASATTQVLAGQSASATQAPAISASTWPQEETSISHNYSKDLSLASSFQPVATSQALGSHNQSSYQTGSTRQVSASQAATNTQAQGSYGVVSSGLSNWYTISHGQSIPFSSQSVATNQVLGSLTQPAKQPSTTPPALAGQSASGSYAQSLDALTLQQEQGSSRYAVPSNQSLTYAVQPVSQSQSSYQPSSTAQGSASQSAFNFQAQGSYGADSFGHATWYTISHGQRIPLSSQSMARNQASGSHSQSYQPGVVLAGLSGPTSSGQSLGVSPYPARAPGGNVVLQGLTNPSSLPVSESQNQSVLASLSADSQALGNYGADSSGRATWYTISHGQSISSTSQAVAINQAFGSQSQLSYQASSTVQDSANQSASNSQGSYGGVSSGPNWYTISLGQSVPFSSQSVATNQILGSLNQPAYQPSTTQPVLAGQSASSSQAQSLDALTLQQEQGSSMYDVPSNQSLMYAVQSVSHLNQASGSQSQSSCQPSSTAQDSASQSAFNAQAQGSYGADSSGHATWYTISQGQSISSASQAVAPNQALGSQSQLSYQASSTAKDSASQSASNSETQGSYGVVSSGLSNWYIISHGQSIPFSSQSVATNQVLGSLNQPAYQPSTTPPVLESQSASSSQAQSLDALTLQQEQGSSMYDVPLNQSLTYAIQSVSQSQPSYQPSSTAQDSASQSVSNSQAQGHYRADYSGHATWYTILRGERIPLSFQTVATNQASGSPSQSSYQTASTSQSASTFQAQPSDASTLDQDLTSGWSKFAFGFYRPSQATANNFGQIQSAQADNL